MTRSPTVLMLSRFFPPAYDIGGKRAHRFATFLPELGWRPVVVTARAPAGRRADPSGRCPQGVTVERSYDPWWWREPIPRPSDGTVNAIVGSGTGPAWLSRLGIPVGPELLSTPHLVHAATRIGRRERANLVWATSSPYSALVAGAAVAWRLGVPLILDLRDPWTLNFMHREFAPWVQRADRRIERQLFEQAAGVCFTSETATAAYRQLYPDLPASRFTTIRNGFDPASEPAVADPSARAGPIRILHFGNCYGPRRLETMLRAIAELRARAPDAPRVELENLGRVGQADVDLARELGIEDAFTWRPFVPFDEGLRRLAVADLAVLVAYGEETLYIPAKLYDYLLARAPIVCLTKKGELSDLVESEGAGRAIEPSDVEGAIAVIKEAIRARSEGRRVFTQDEGARASFSARAAAKLLVAELNRGVTKRAEASS